MSNTLHTIAVDLTPVLPDGENGGAKLFVLELLRILAEMKPKTDFILLTQEASHEELSALDCANMRRVMVRTTSASPTKSNQLHAGANILPLVSRNIHRTAIRLKKSIMKRMGKHPIKTRKLLKEMAVDLLFCPFTAPTYYEPEIPVVSTIYDLQYKTYPEFFTPEDVALRNKTFLEACSRATMLTAISDYSRKSAIQHGNIEPDRIRTIYLQMAQRITSKTENPDKLLNHFGLTSNLYFIYPANFWKHKNHEILLTAFAISTRQGLPQDIKLVCTGAPGERQQWLIRAASVLGLENRVIFPGYLPTDELSSLLSHAAGMVFPSLYEGFGLPVIEAMAAGIPVACSNTRSLPEISGNAALLFDPGVPEQISQSMVNLIDNLELRKRLIAAGKIRAAEFSDTKMMGNEYWELFENAMAINKRKKP
ncbi:MAG: glycosyltransferase family 4 protein [Chlorobium sp.]|uniref:glycosyltransferase family 4 protein n=1 Tax=Chlorobium sp. TaxID=1095 RepID=UPI0025BED2F4|nr:glycosyltransferase family 1 protein [Chlorobium sp.]MCF8383978.1 glycosyltransferase family 4 protein [Chlorobium sp.]